MATSSAELTKQIKAANDIVDVVSGYVRVHPAGKLFKCICPFHDDHRPSLTLNREWQNYKCWSCGAAGDVITFVEKFEKLNFKEARAFLAKRANIRLEDESPQDDRKSILFETMRWAQQKYQQYYFESPEADAARTYVGERKIAGSLVRQFGIGFSPVEGNWLASEAARDGVDCEALAELGLLLTRDEGKGYFDRFRERVMFPVRDTQGRVVAFGGRILPSSHLAARQGKYINSPTTPLFNKSEVIYGLDMARHAGTKDGFLAVVEGYTDVMMAHHYGFTNVVATMGTSLTAQHVAQLRRFVPKVVLVYDADAGGTTGVDRALELFVSQDVELAVASLPEGLDPADLLSRENGAEEFRQGLLNAKDALEFKLESLLKKGDRGVEGSRRMIDAVLGVMAVAPPVPSQGGQMKQELILNRLAHRLGVNQSSIWSRFRELKAERRQAERNQIERRDAATNTPTPTGNTSIPRAAQAPDPLARQLLQILLAEPGLIAKAKARLQSDDIRNVDAQRMLDELYHLDQSGEPADLDGLRIKLIDRPDLITAAMRLLEIGRTLTDRAKCLDNIIGGFRDRRSQAEVSSIKGELSAAEGDENRQIELLRKLQDRAKRPAAVGGSVK
ncbi:MAG: DNA primase [Gemmataceae bacterium]